jgi:hypothetical protein
VLSDITFGIFEVVNSAVNNYQSVSLVIIVLLSVLAGLMGMFTVTPTFEIYPKARQAIAIIILDIYQKTTLNLV